MFTSLLVLALAAGRPFTVDDLLALERAGEPAISPDGALVAYTVARAAPAGEKLLSTLFVVPARPGAAPRRLTFGDERVTAPVFSPDGRRVAFLSTRGGGVPQVHVLDLAGGEASRATDLAAGASMVRWTSDGQALLVTSDVDPACGADAACNRRADDAAAKRPHASTRLLFRHWSAWRERVRSHLLLVPLDGSAVRDLTPGDRDVPPAERGSAKDLAVSPDGKTVYFVAISDPLEAISTNGDVYAVPLAGGEPRRVTTGPGWDGVPRPSPDGKRLAWLSMARAGYEADKLRVMVADADGGTPRDLTAALDVSADELWWAKGGKALRFTALVGARHQIFEVDAAGGPVRQVSRLSANVGAVSVSRDGERAAAAVDALTAPPEIAVLALSPQPPKGDRAIVDVPVTAIAGRGLAGIALGAVRPLEAKGQDGQTIHGLVVLPPGHRDGERHPAVVLVHGGPQGAWVDGWSWRWNAMLYAARGWTVILPNPRGSTGRGQGYQDAVRNDWGGLPYDDVMRLTDAAIAAGLADGERMCAAGASYGGYLVHWLNGQTGRFRCLVSHAGVFDTHAAYFDTEELWFPEWEMGGPAYENPEAYERWSPRRLVSRWKTPTLVTHGELDYRVTVTQGLSAFTALQRRGIPSKLLVFPDEGHWILKPRNAKVFHEEVLGWIDRWLGEPARAEAAP
jgi:dipeptidyl aminopeptidase/acylaminoacyl peptidase